MRKRFALTSTLLALVVAASGCASSGGASAAASGETFPVSIVVDNNLSGLKAVTVQIAGPNVNKLLGSVDSGRRKTFSYNAHAGTYALVYRTSSPNDQPVTSQQVQIAGPVSYVWHLSSNSLVEGQ